MKFYKGIIPNTEFSENFIGTQKAFIDYLNAFIAYEVESNQQNYVITNQVRIKSNGTIAPIAYDITYIYDDKNNYFYHVKSCTTLQDTIIFDVMRDTWAMEVMEHSKDIKQLNITRSNLELSNSGIYDPINSTLKKPYYEKLFKQYNEPVKMGVVFVASITFEKIFESSEGKKSTFYTQIRTYGFKNSEIQSIFNSYSISGDTLPLFAVKLVSGISIFNQEMSEGVFHHQEFKVLKAYLVDEDLFDIQSTGDYCTAVINGGEKYVFCKPVIQNIKFTNLKIDTTNDQELYVGTINANMKYVRNNAINAEIQIACTTKQNGLEVKIMQGDNVMDITKAFEIVVTVNEGLMTTQEKTERSLMNLGGIISTAGSIMHGGFSGITSGIMTGLNTMFNLSKGNTNYSMTQGGDGVSTFEIDMEPDYSFSPYYIIRYESNENIKRQIGYNGLNYNFNINNLYAILNKDLISESKQFNIPKTIYGHASMLDSFTLDTQNLINTRLQQGLKFKVL